jgi:hypothetical protein
MEKITLLVGVEVGEEESCICFCITVFFFLRKKVEMDIEWGTYSVCCI